MNTIVHESICRICKSALSIVPEFFGLLRVTSDCRPWKDGGVLAVCQGCATIDVGA